MNKEKTVNIELPLEIDMSSVEMYKEKQYILNLILYNYVDNEELRCEYDDFMKAYDIDKLIKYDINWPDKNDLKQLYEVVEKYPGQFESTGNLNPIDISKTINDNVNCNRFHNEIIANAENNGVRLSNNRIELMEKGLKDHKITLKSLSDFVDKIIDKSNENKMQWYWNVIDNPLVGEDMVKFNQELSAEGNQEYAAEHMRDLANEYKDEKGTTFATITYEEGKYKFDLTIHDKDQQIYSHKDHNQLIKFAEELHTHKLVKEVVDEKYVDTDNRIHLTDSNRINIPAMDLSM